MWRSRLCLLLFLIVAACAAIPYKNRHSLSRKNPRFKNRPFNFKKDDGLETSDKIQRVAKVFRYDLKLTPYMQFEGLDSSQRQDYTFDGDVTMHFQITNKTSYLPFRSEKLTVSKVFLKFENSKKSLALKSFSINEDTTEGKVAPVSSFIVGQNYTLRIVYSGNINKGGYNVNSQGMYFDNYTDSTGQYRQLVSTFFEPTNSRKVFPNLDDPYFKSILSFTLVYPKNAKVYSNMLPIDGGRAWNQYKQLVEFKDTPLMSTYLFAFAVGDFAEASAKTRRNIPVKAMAAKHLISGLQDAANRGADCIDAMESLVSVNYPLEKLDNVDMFTMEIDGAMEDFGMIVYTLFLSISPTVTVTHDLYEKNSIMCHEPKLAVPNLYHQNYQI